MLIICQFGRQDGLIPIGSKLGIELYAVEITPAGDLLVLDSINSNIYRVQLPLSPCEHALPPTSPCPF